MSSSFTVIIPARLASTRLPDKPLADIAGKPMIMRVVEQASQSGAARVVVATDSERIADVVQAAGCEFVMTSPDHPSGTDRLQEAAHLLALHADDIVVNVQGDEPFIPPAVIDQVASTLRASGARMASLYEPIQSPSDAADPNIVKVVTNEADEALYFSRACIPHDRDSGAAPVTRKRHLGIYGYRVSLLNDFVGWDACELEETEKLEQLRALWYGVVIQMARANSRIPPGVDTAEDLDRARQFMETADV